MLAEETAPWKYVSGWAWKVALLFCDFPSTSLLLSWHLPCTCSGMKIKPLWWALLNAVICKRPCVERIALWLIGLNQTDNLSHPTVPHLLPLREKHSNRRLDSRFICNICDNKFFSNKGIKGGNMATFCNCKWYGWRCKTAAVNQYLLKWGGRFNCFRFGNNCNQQSVKFCEIGRVGKFKWISIQV